MYSLVWLVTFVNRERKFSDDWFTFIFLSISINIIIINKLKHAQCHNYKVYNTLGFVEAQILSKNFFFSVQSTVLCLAIATESVGFENL